MKVYVVDYEDTWSRHTAGVFSSEEKARAFVKAEGSWEAHHYDVEEWEVDEKCQ